MLLEYGNTIVDYDWKIDEKIPPGYSRVYYVYHGEVEYEDEQCKILLKHGHLYIFPSASTYRMKQNPQNRLHCTFFHIDVFPALIVDLVEVTVEGNPVLEHILMSIAASIDVHDNIITFALVDIFEVFCKEHNLIASPIQPISNVLIYIAEHMKTEYNRS